MPLISNIFVLIILLALSALFSGMEIAFFSLSDLRVRHLVKKKKLFAETVKKLKDDKHTLLITILIGNNVVNVAAASLATAITINLVKSNAVGIATGIMTFLILLFGEILPKAIASKHTEVIALVCAKPLELLTKILKPIIFIFKSITTAVTKLTGGETRPIVTEEEIKSIVQEGEDAGEINEMEREMIHKIFRFDDTSVSEIMTPKADMVTVEGNGLLVDQIGFFLKTRYSRIPVYDKSNDKIIGIVLLKDVIKYIHQNKVNIKIRDIMKEPYFVPETKKIDSMLKQFQKRKQHMAIAVDEHGSISGLLTIEDVLEEIVGEIIDETEKIEPYIIKKDDKTYTVKGKTDIEEVNKKLNIKLKETDEFDTIGGYVLNKLGKIPEAGTEINLKKFTIEVSKVENNRIEEVSIVFN